MLENGVVFRLYGPSLTKVTLFTFNEPEEELESHFELSKDDSGVWNLYVEEDLTGKYYAFKVREESENPVNEITSEYLADPFGKAQSSQNNYKKNSRTHIFKDTEFNWENDSFIKIEDPRDLIIYECHIKDLVAHSSAKTYVQGIYNDFSQAKVGGIHHLKSLGINSVEFLPLQNFAYFEPPYQKETESGLINTWNVTARNYWGYMTSYFFSPESIYASDAHLEKDKWIGKSTAATQELKGLVKELHKENIAVIMDVVYNHASQYDLNPLKYTNKQEAFRIDENGDYVNNSWTGNDIKSESHFGRNLIVESVKYWMKEFHIDGFRFDLAGIIDWETIDLIKLEAQKINPDVILIAEPWGGEYKPFGFSERGWSSWNDKIRNAMKGSNPIHDKGFIFGEWSHGVSRFGLENLIRGTLLHNDLGMFESSAHTVNYVESHDGYTLGDFIRIALNPKMESKKVKNRNSVVQLSNSELNIAKLAAVTLFVSQGVTMMHAGQEWARSKVIVDHTGKDKNTGKLDHDSYNKDNETNWLNFNEISKNQELYEYYLGLIQLRKKSPALRKSAPSDIVFQVYNDPLHLTFYIDGLNSGDSYDYFISLNGNLSQENDILLPDGYWEVVVNSDKASFNTFFSIQDKFILSPSSGIVLRKLRMTKS